MNISEDYVGQFFRNNIGFSPQDYIEHRRMEKAIKILREKTDAIKVISNDVGFRTHLFRRRFKMMFGVQARKMKKKLNKIGFNPFLISFSIIFFSLEFDNWNSSKKIIR